MKESARIDKWLWAARIYKTLSIAADACKNGRVMVGGVNRKPCLLYTSVFLSITYLMCIFASVLGNLINESFKNIRE